MGTITPYPNFDPEADSKKLFSAMEGVGEQMRETKLSSGRAYIDKASYFQRS